MWISFGWFLVQGLGKVLKDSQTSFASWNSKIKENRKGALPVQGQGS